MSRWHADIWSHPGHYPVNPYTSPWSPKGHGYGHEWPIPIPFVQWQSAVRFLRYSYLKNWPWKSMVKAMPVLKGEGHIWPWKFKVKGMWPQMISSIFMFMKGILRAHVRQTSIVIKWFIIVITKITMVNLKIIFRHCDKKVIANMFVSVKSKHFSFYGTYWGFCSQNTS